MQSVPPSIRRWTRRLGLALVALLLLGIAGEVWLRLHPSGRDESEVMEQLRSQWRQMETIYVPDPEFGALLAPSRHDTFETTDFTYTRDTDHAGFPNPEPWPRQAHVAVLGDSLLIGTGVGLNGQFSSLLERRLDGRQVLNLGLPGGGTEHQYRTYRRFAAALEPDLVIAVLWVIWDIDNSLEFEHWRIEKSDMDYTQYRKTYAITHRGDTQAPGSAVTRIWQFVKRQLSKSHLVLAGYAGAKSLLGINPIVERVTFPNGDTILLSPREELRLARGVNRPDTPNLQQIFFRPLERLRNEVEAHGGRFVIVLVPSKEELYAAEAFPTVLRTVEAVKSELESRRLPVLDLYPAFRERGRESPPFYRADMHLNELGNRIVADELARWIADERIFTGPSSATNVAGSGAD